VLNVEADQLAEGLALPIWNIDRAQIDKVVDGVGSVPHVYAITVEAAGQTHARLRDQQWRFGPWNGRSPPAELLVEERLIRFSGETIGTLRIFATRRFIDEALRRSLWSMIVTIVLVDLLLSLSVYAILWPSVLRPLGRIEQYAHAVSAGPANVDMHIDTGAAEELNSLRSSIQSMVHALREALDFTDTAINAMTGLFFVMNRDGKVIRRNETMDRLTDDEHRSTRPPLSLVHPDDKARAVRTIAEVFERGVSEVELRVEVAGVFRDFLINARKMDVHGESFIVGSGIDITERRQAEAEQLRLRNELALSAMEWRQTFDTVVTPILITDRNGSIRRFNRAALELAGLSEFELVGTRVEAVSSGEPWSTAAQLVSSIAPHDALATAETRDRQGRTWDIAITHFASPGNGDDRFILVFWEITGIVELQESLRRSETLSAMGTLVAGVAHEVRNPLFGMSATLDAYHEELSRPGYELFEATLRREVRRLTNLMQELLEYGKPSVLSLERESVPNVIDEAVESRSAAAQAAGVEVENLVEKNGVTLLIDRSRLRQVFENLIDNAVQHSPAGGHVWIRSRPVEQAGRRWVELLVEDEGRGFRPQDLDRVFDPFYTVREGGTGLGLSIVQRIVEEHAGKVVAGNRPGGGAVVTILLPVADAHPAAKTVGR
jgi:PAS domain S-box-containing protein